MGELELQPVPPRFRFSFSWQRPRVAGSIHRGSKYWRRRRWWPELQSYLRDLQKMFDDARGPTFDNIEIRHFRVMLGPDGLPTLETWVRYKPSPTPVEFTVTL